MMGIYDRNFRDGAFQSLIPRTTDTVRALNVLLDSPLLSAAEKANIRGLLTEFQFVCTRFPNGAEPGPMDTVGVMMAIERVCTIFDSDARARGEYVPPQFVMQSLDPNNKVRETRVWNQATQTMTIHQGGVAGVPPGAPPGYSGGSAFVVSPPASRSNATSAARFPSHTATTDGAGEKKQEKANKETQSKGEPSGRTYNFEVLTSYR